MRILIPLAVLLGLLGMRSSNVVDAAVINVPADQPTIQDGINAAVSGADEVVVAPGTYNEIVDLFGKAITLRSSGGAAVTTIDGSGLGASVIKCISGEGPGTVLDGFTITGGAGDIFTGVTFGGGMRILNSSPTVIDCTFSGNTASRGGGMANESSSPDVINCTFSNNTSEFGGAMINNNSSPTITSCTFSGHVSGSAGGAMFNGGSSPMVTNCTFRGNRTGRAGGGMFNGGSSPKVTNCRFVGEAAITGGGGMANDENSNPEVTNCTFSGNTSRDGGGGMWNRSSSPMVADCTFSGNTIVNVAGNSMLNRLGSSPMISNCILWGDSSDQIFNLDANSQPTVGFSDVRGDLPGGTTDGGGNINTDPLFVDADGDDNIVGTEDDNLRLSPGFSPCIDAGDNTTVPAGVTTDLDGNPRFADDPDTPDSGNGTPPIVDMGAYELLGAPDDCNGNGIPDSEEGTKSVNFCVQCASPSPPNDCSNGTGWSFLLDWEGPDFENLSCGPVIPTAGTTAADMAAEFIDCINATVCSSITAAPSGGGRCFKVTVPGNVRPQICVGPEGGPSNACCPNPPCSFNANLVEVLLAGVDCNGTGIDDAIDIFLATSPDNNENGIPDECEELIPTVSEWGLVVMTLLMLAAGTVVIGRSRRARAGLPSSSAGGPLNRNMP